MESTPPPTMQVRNPRTGEFDYELRLARDPEVKAAVASLRENQRTWKSSGLDARIGALKELAGILSTTAKDSIVEALTTDTGRRAMCTKEVFAVCGMITGLSNSAPFLLQETQFQPARNPMAKGIVSRVQRVPLGVVGVISPWNFPLILSFIDALPALVAGNAVIIKPSEVTPRFAEPLKEAIAQVPALASVLQIVCGDGQTGATVVGHVDAVCFTGSVKTGRIVAEACAKHFIPAFLELGGKDPAVVLASAELETTAETVLRASVAMTGQACQSLERVYVHESVFDQFTTLLAEKAQKLQLSHPDPNSGHLGPFIFGAQAEIVADHIKDAVDKGAKVLSGGEVQELDGGLYCNATVLTNVTHKMKVTTEETFGPVIPVMSFSDTEEAVRLANDSVYGLSASVFGEAKEAEEVALLLNAGSVSINDASLTAYFQETENDPFGLSGMGKSRMGASSLMRFFRSKALILQQGTARTTADIAEAETPSSL